MTLLFMVMLVVAAGNTAMQSVLPSIGTALGAHDVWISIAFSWSALLWVVCAPMWARRSDRRGRKAMMALGLVGFASSMALCGIVFWFGLGGAMGAGLTLVLFAAARSLYGLLGSAAPPAVQAYVASRTARSERTGALSVISSSFGLGTILGPALAPLMVVPVLGLTGPFVGFALMATVVLVLLRLRLPDDEPRYAARGETFDAPYSANAVAHLRDGGDEEHGRSRLGWRDARLRPWIVTGVLGGQAQAMVLGVVGFLVLDRLALRDHPMAGASPVGLVMMCGAFATLLAQWGLIPMLKLGPRAATLGGAALAGMGTALFGAATNLHTIALGFALASLGFGLFRPGFTAGASLAVSREEQGEIGGIVASVNGSAYVVSPAIGVWLYGHSDWLGFAAIIASCLGVLAYGWRNLQRDEALTGPR
ncbi:MAG: MFS transporter [Sphingomonadales bacterium]|nr:MFS transporter [Sphingomonadales bacterium]MBD3774375.1 MFS transporter [Paracoccaceae bacterium]